MRRAVKDWVIELVDPLYGRSVWETRAKTSAGALRSSSMAEVLKVAQPRAVRVYERKGGVLVLVALVDYHEPEAYSPRPLTELREAIARLERLLA